MNIYEMEGFLHGKCMPRDILVNESTAEYLVRKLNEATTVKAERDALAAENAALKVSRETLSKNALETCNDVFSAGFRNASLQLGLMESTGNRNLYPNPIKALVDEAIRELETPATDAAIAEIEARAIKSALDSCSEHLDADYVMDRFGISYDDAELRASGARELHGALIAYAVELREASNDD